MKIAVKVSIEMTDEQLASLANEYGLTDGDTVKAAIAREWVKEYVKGLAQGSPAAEFWTATVA